MFYSPLARTVTEYLSPPNMDSLLSRELCTSTSLQIVNLQIVQSITMLNTQHFFTCIRLLPFYGKKEAN